MERRESEAPALVAQEVRGEPRVSGAAGRILDYLDVCVIDDDGEVLAIGGIGEICITGRRDGPWGGLYRPFLGYWSRAAATSKLSSMAWFELVTLAMSGQTEGPSLPIERETRS